MIGIILFSVLGVLIVLGVPVAISLGLSALITIMVAVPVPITVVVQRMFTATDSFPLMAVPFFMLAGALMEQGGISKRLINFANSLLGAVYGGLALVAIGASAFFAAISGSSAATTAAIGSIMIPAMVRRNYDKSWAAAVQASGGMLGIVIPPSIPMITYGVITGVSISGLFIGGLIPGIIMAASLMMVAYYEAKKMGYMGEKRKSWKDVWVSFREAILSLLMPVIVLGGIYGGVFTPTEAAVVAVVYGFLISGLVYRAITIKNLFEILSRASISTAVVMLLVATASLFGWVLTWGEVPQKVASGLAIFSSSHILLLLIINLIFLLVGTFLDTLAAILILVPILLPVVKSAGIDLLHFGIITVVNLAVGQITPPFGVCLFVAGSIASLKLEDIIKRIIPFFLILVIDILIITYIPPLSTFLPSLLQ